jgi:hypothetical protein
MHNARSFADGRSIPPLRILYAFMVCTGTSAPVLPSNSPFGKNPFFAKLLVHQLFKTLSAFYSTRKFYKMDNTTMTVWVRAQFTTCYTFAVFFFLYPFDLTVGRTLLQAKVPSMRVLMQLTTHLL